MVGAEATRPLSFERDGAALHSGALAAVDLDELRTFADHVLEGRSGSRLFGPVLRSILAPEGRMGRIAAAALDGAGRPVRAIMFDKTATTNWAVHWHQDRTIAVTERIDVPGFGPWTKKAGVIHVEPPFDILAGMVTLRAHLDDCDADNAALVIAPGSHRIGRIEAADISDAVTRLGQMTCCASAGDVWLYATPILHASERAHRPRRRRVLHVDFAAADLPGGLQWLGVG